MLPAKPQPLVCFWFDRWCRKALRERFRHIHLYGQSSGALDQFSPTTSRLYAANHSSFWDAIVMNHLAREYSLGRMCMVDEVQVIEHPFYRRVGGFGVDRATPRDAVETIRYAAQQLTGPNAIGMLIFPQGRMQPIAKPLDFQYGVGHILRRAPVAVVPVALRYSFWADQRGEALVWVGDALYPRGTPRQAAQLLQRKIELGLGVLAKADAEQRPGDRIALAGRESITQWLERTPWHARGKKKSLNDRKMPVQAQSAAAPTSSGSGTFSR